MVNMEYLMHIVGNESKWLLWTIKEDITPASNRSSSYNTQVATIYYILAAGLNNSILSVLKSQFASSGFLTNYLSIQLFLLMYGAT